jgi:hypothetical protein
MKPLQRYDIEIAGLATAVTACQPEASHKALLHRLRSFDLLSNAKLATTRGGDGSHYFSRRKVLRSSGELIHDHHEEWVKQQLQLDGGDATKTYKRLRDEKFLLSKCELTTLYFVHDKGSDNPADFIQVAIRQQDEFIDSRAFERYSWSPPKTIQDLLNEVEGEALPAEERRRMGPPMYQLEAVVDVEAFVPRRRRSKQGTVSRCVALPTQSPMHRPTDLLRPRPSRMTSFSPAGTASLTNRAASSMTGRIQAPVAAENDFAITG